MNPKYNIGQKVVITPAESQGLSPRDSILESLAGQSGDVVEYHWIQMNRGVAFYIYTVRVNDGKSEVILHEDELGIYLS